MTNLDMTRSEYILKRLILLQTMQAPTISDATKNFGDDFAQKFGCNCDPNFLEDLGLTPPLKGPIGGDLWTSPSDLLIGKVCLKPPLTSKHIRALTHQGIMEIGLKIEKLFWNQVEIEKSKELEEQDRTLKLLCETSKKEAIAKVQARMLEIFERQRLELVNEMDELCKEEMRRMEMKYYLDLQDELRDQARELEQYYQMKMEEEISRHSELMIVKSAANLEEMETSMRRAFQIQLQKADIRVRFEIQKEQTRCREKIKALQHELECKNLANMMYLICMERKKCIFEKSNTEDQFTKEIRELNAILREKEAEIAGIKAEREKHKKEVELREKALLEIVKEFQKFINFALKAVPKQAEYLLCAEKLMVFELTDALSKAPEEKTMDHDRDYLWARTPELSDSTGSSLKVKDGHDCLRQPEISESEYSVGHFLPGFFYNDQLFVREDFRNMVSQGITVNENNMLWTEHVQKVIDRLEQPCQSCVFNEKKENGTMRNLERRRSLVSYQSSVHFSMKDTDKPSMMSVDKDKKFRRASLKPVEPEHILQTIDFNHIGSEENRKTLISARNSLEVLKDNIVKRKSSVKSEDIKHFKVFEEEPRTVDNLSEEKEIMQTGESRLNLEAKDSVIKAKVEQLLGSTTDMLPKKEIITDVPLGRRISKISETVDSVEVLKKRDSISRSKNLGTKCSVSDCNILQPKTSSEETVTKITESQLRKGHNKDTERMFELPRRISIAFTGRSVIYEKDEEDSQHDIKVTKIPFKSKKTKPTKSYKTMKVGKDKVIEKKKFPKSPREHKDKHGIMKATEKIVVGDSNMNFYNQTDDQFSSDRIKSFVNILKDHPNLLRLFTSVTR